MIKRRKTRQINIGHVKLGDGSPISVQSMAKKDIKNISTAIKEIEKLQDAGCEIVRVAIKDQLAANAISDIKSKTNIPLVADIHFNYKLALIAIEKGADAIRINPGNIGR